MVTYSHRADSPYIEYTSKHDFDAEVNAFV